MVMCAAEAKSTVYETCVAVVNGRYRLIRRTCVQLRLEKATACWAARGSRKQFWQNGKGAASDQKPWSVLDFALLHRLVLAYGERRRFDRGLDF